MVAATAEEFLQYTKGFEMYSTEELDRWLAFVEAVHCPATIWIDLIRQWLAVILRIAHYLEIRLEQMSESVNIGASASIGQGASSGGGVMDDLDQTVYGRQFKQLRSTLPATGFAF